MPKFKNGLTPEAKSFVAAAGEGQTIQETAAVEPASPPAAKVQVVFRLPPATRTAITRLAAQRTLDTGKRVAEQALFEEALELLIQKYAKQP